MGILLSKPQPDSIVQQQRTIYPALTGLRFIAASIIFVFHNQDLIPETVPLLLRNIIAEFHIGVSVFFVLSGFLIANQFSGTSFEKPKAYFKYLAIRFGRIFPLYWAILIVLQMLWLYSIPEFFVHAALLKGYFRGFHHGVAQAWSLTVELAFYATAPFIYKAMLNGKTRLAFLVITLIGVGLTGIGSTLTQLGLNPYEFVPDLKFAAFNTFFGRASEFFAGMLLYYLVIHKGKDWPEKWLPLTYGGILFLIVSSLILNTFQTPADLSVHTWGGLAFHHTIIPFAIAVILYGLIRENTYLSWLLSTRFLILLGNASYAFYLIHFGWVNNWLIHNVTDSPFLLFIILWVTSIGVYLAFDKPVYLWLRKRISAL